MDRLTDKTKEYAKKVHDDLMGFCGQRIGEMRRNGVVDEYAQALAVLSACLLRVNSQLEAIAMSEGGLFPMAESETHAEALLNLMLDVGKRYGENLNAAQVN
jgi:hypothetical protein